MQSTLDAQMITTTYLEIRDLSELRLPQRSDACADLLVKWIHCPDLAASLYSCVGKNQYWDIYRWGWTSEHWRLYLQRADMEFWAAYLNGSPIGYFELRCHADASVEIVIFGVLPDFTGQGIGGRLLTSAVKRALTWQATRVWLHTCSLDHPFALKNYYARGFKFVREEITDYIPLDDMPEVVQQAHGDGPAVETLC